MSIRRIRLFRRNVKVQPQNQSNGCLFAWQKSITNRASIFQAITNEKISRKQMCLSSKLTLNSTKCLQIVQNQKVWHKGRAMENQNKIFLANSDPISVNFSKGQVNWTTSLSDLDSELDIVYKLNWPAQKTTEKTT